MVYLDYNATTPLCPEALESMLPWLEGRDGAYGNPSSIHQAGRQVRAAIDEARDQWAHWLGGKPHEVIFTAGGTESDNLAILGLARRHRPRGHHLITSALEHHAVLHAMEFLRDQEGFELTILPVNQEGLLEENLFLEALRPETILVSIMEANNETGVIQPIEKLARHCQERGILFHTDAVQTFGKRRCKPRELQVDALSITAHKFYGPRGAGLLWLRSGVEINSIFYGGFQENQRRPGTENTASIVGMTSAACLALKEVELGFQAQRQGELREVLWRGIQQIYPQVVRHGKAEHTLFNTLHVHFPHVDGEMLLIALDLEGIAVSSGSACMVGSIRSSHVLAAMGIPASEAQGAVRFSLGRQTSQEDIHYTLAALERVLARQRPSFEK